MMKEITKNQPKRKPNIYNNKVKKKNKKLHAFGFK